jgi:hypothetical protein
MMLKTLHTILSHYCFYGYVYNQSMSMIRDRRLYIAYTCDYKVIYIVLHFINKSAFIILLETADSLRCFCIIVSFYIIYYYMIGGEGIS